MQRIGLAVLGIVLLAAGIAGVVWTVSSRSPSNGGVVYRQPPTTDSGTGLSGANASLGAQIYLDGIGENGNPIPRTVLAGPGMMGGGCVTCHGIDGKGGRIGMMGGFTAPDIRYSTLTSPHEEHAEEAWTEADIRRAVVEGIEPDGGDLNEFMPRWELNSNEFNALLDYLKELDNK